MPHMPAVPSTLMAMFDAMTLEDLDVLCPADRERLRVRCELWAKLAAERKGAARREPRSMAVVIQCAAEETRALALRTVGIIAQLKRGERAEDSDERYAPRLITRVVSREVRP